MVWSALALVMLNEGPKGNKTEDLYFFSWVCACVCVCRPTELFRSCNTQSDQGALNDIRLWEKGSIQMPFMSIPVLDISKCRPDMWRAVACALQIKPCYSKSRGSVICKYASLPLNISQICKYTSLPPKHLPNLQVHLSTP